MFTETTIILLGLFVACEICTLIVFCYQRTVRKLSLRLKLAQSALNICYPSWMLAMYWATFSKYAIALALLIIDWRCALVAAGMFVLFFLVSACISVPDGTNLIRIYKEVKKRGSGALRTGVYQALISEIEKGIVATGGDLAKLNKMENEDLEWTSKTHMTHGHVWHANDNNSSQTNGGYSCFSQGNESDLMNDLSVKRHKEILESKDIRKYLELYEEAPTPVKISVVIWGLWVIIGLVLGFVFEESIQSNIGTAFVNVLFIAAILRGSRWVRNFYAIGVLIFAILVGVNSIFPDSFIDYAMSISIILNCLMAVVYICPLFTKSAHSWFYGNRQDSSKSKWIIALLVFVTAILLLLIVAAFNDCEYGFEATGRHKAKNGDGTNPRSSENILQKAMRLNGSTRPISKRADEKVGKRVSGHYMFSDGESQSEAFEADRASIKPSKPLSEWTDAELIAYIRQGAERGDLNAIDSLNKTASEGNDVLAQCAQIALAEMYETGKGVARNKGKALMWYRKAAEQGNVNAQIALSRIYLFSPNADEVEKGEGVKWLRKAAEKGEADAQYLLGACYFSGEGVAQSDAEGIKWCRMSAKHGNVDARKMLQEKGLLW